MVASPVNQVSQNMLFKTNLRQQDKNHGLFTLKTRKIKLFLVKEEKKKSQTK